MKQCRPVAEVTERMLTADKGFVLLSDIVRYGFHGVPTNGIQEVARSIRVSSTNKIKHYLGFEQHRTGALSENLSEFVKFCVSVARYKSGFGFWLSERIRWYATRAH
jgi:hypothetical protein